MAEYFCCVIYYFFSAETEGSLDVTKVIEEFINRTMISVDELVPVGESNGSAPSEVLSKDGFQLRSHFIKFLLLLECFS